MSTKSQSVNSENAPRGPIIALVVIVAIVFAVLFWHSYSSNNGTAVLALDDPYIHLAMARNLAAHGVWGVTPDAFSATSSAPLYTLTLAILFLITGPTAFWSWFLAVTGGLLVTCLLGWRLGRSFSTPAIVVVGGLWCVIVAGLPESMFTGLEHMLHAAVILLIAHLLSWYADNRQPGRRHDLSLLLLILAAAGLRYESLFAVPFVFGYLVWQGRKALAIQAVIVSVIPAVVVGVMQLANGAWILPNSLLLKGVMGHGGGLGFVKRFLLQIDSPYVSVLLVLSAAGLLWAVMQRRDLRADSRLAPAGLFISIVIFQALFAQLERRYVPFIVALGIWAVIPWISEWARAIRERLSESSTSARWRTIAVWAMVLCLGVFPFSSRVKELDRLPNLGHDIYLQQYQVARFFSTEYTGQTVALNDIGMTAWAGENSIVDLWGLGNNEIAWKRFKLSYTTNDIRNAVSQANVSAVAVYLHWFAAFGGLPQEWKLVGVLQLPSGVQTNAAGPQVMFYAPTATEAQILSSRLRSFAPSLPKDVIFTPLM